jgi:hypothetical protein
MESIVMFKISSDDFNMGVKGAVEQSIQSSHGECSMFEFTLVNTVNHVHSISSWVENNGFFFCSVQLDSIPDPDQIKTLTDVGSLLGNCRVDVMMETEITDSYYQFFNGNLDCFFNFCKERSLYFKLSDDFSHIKHMDKAFRVSLIQEMDSLEYEVRKGKGKKTYKLPVYTLSGEEKCDKERLEQAIYWWANEFISEKPLHSIQ